MKLSNAIIPHSRLNAARAALTDLCAAGDLDKAAR